MRTELTATDTTLGYMYARSTEYALDACEKSEKQRHFRIGKTDTTGKDEGVTVSLRITSFYLNSMRWQISTRCIKRL